MVAKSPKRAKSGTSMTSYLGRKIAETQAAEDQLRRANLKLQQTKDDLQMQELRCQVGIDMANDHMRLEIAKMCLMSSQRSGLQHRANQCEGSIHAIPPRTNWDVRVTLHLDQISQDAYRYLSFTASQHLSKLLAVAIKAGPQSTAHTELSIVIDKVMTISAYMLRANPSVLLANMGRHLGTGDASTPPDEAWWAKVANSLPLALVKPEPVAKMRSYASIYCTNMASIHNERESLAKALKKFSSDPIEYTGDSSSLQAVESNAPTAEKMSSLVVEDRTDVKDAEMVDFEADPLTRMDKILLKMKENLSREVSERMLLVEFFRTQVATPISVAALVSLSFPYVLDGPAVMAQLVKRFECS